MTGMLFPTDPARKVVKFTGSKDQAEQVIIEHISELCHISTDSIHHQCTLTHDLSFDSLDTTELVMWCEMTFNVAINHNEPTKTVGDIVNAVITKL